MTSKGKILQLPTFNSQLNNTWSQTQFTKDHCTLLPENSLTFTPQQTIPDSQMDESTFNEVLHHFALSFDHLFTSQGLSLEVIGEWKNSKVNAYATRDLQDNGKIVVTGGLARHPLLTRDALVLVLCHELGHFWGGAPKARRGNSQKLSWSSAEGQADYFATSKCMKQLIAQEKGQWFAQRPNEVEEAVVAHTFCSTQDCERIIQAGLDLARVFASTVPGGRLPSLQSHDSSVVSQTLSKHPSAQCRLDTFVAGTYCQVTAEQPFSDVDTHIGACSSINEAEAIGARPPCWYKP